MARASHAPAAARERECVTRERRGCWPLAQHSEISTHCVLARTACASLVFDGAGSHFPCAADVANAVVRQAWLAAHPATLRVGARPHRHRALLLAVAQVAGVLQDGCGGAAAGGPPGGAPPKGKCDADERASAALRSECARFLALDACDWQEVTQVCVCRRVVGHPQVHCSQWTGGGTLPGSGRVHSPPPPAGARPTTPPHPLTDTVSGRGGAHAADQGQGSGCEQEGRGHAAKAHYTAAGDAHRGHVVRLSWEPDEDKDLGVLQCA